VKKEDKNRCYMYSNFWLLRRFIVLLHINGTFSRRNLHRFITRQMLIMIDDSCDFVLVLAINLSLSRFQRTRKSVIRVSAHRDEVEVWS